MSLREEITRSFNMTFDTPEPLDNRRKNEIKADYILKLIEKRIDILIQECKDKEKQYPIAVRYRIAPLLELKELLK